MSALEYLASKDIIHGNITPDNLIFDSDSDGYIYLCDFKMAMVLNGDQVWLRIFIGKVKTDVSIYMYVCVSSYLFLFILKKLKDCTVDEDFVSS